MTTTTDNTLPGVLLDLLAEADGREVDIEGARVHPDPLHVVQSILPSPPHHPHSARPRQHHPQPDPSQYLQDNVPRPMQRPHKPVLPDPEQYLHRSLGIQSGAVTDVGL